MPKRLSDCRVTVVGLGLMGASLCMDLVQGHHCREVRGVAHRLETALRAFFADAVDRPPPIYTQASPDIVDPGHARAHHRQHDRRTERHDPVAGDELSPTWAAQG
ncbi:MAG: hypothetical protein R2856_20485 [Caldilineaceae bacterium]